MVTQKRMFLDEDEIVLPETKRRRKQVGRQEQQEQASAVMEEDLPLIIEQDEDEKEEENVVSCDADVSMCRDLAPCPKIQVNLPLEHYALERYTSLPIMDHRLRPSSSSLAIVPYVGKLPETSPREGDKNELDKQCDLMMTD